MAGAVLHRPLQAQVRDTIPKRKDSTVAIPVPARADSILRDTLVKRGESVKRDSIMAPITHAEVPAQVTIAHTLHWSRDSLFATGALTVTDLLERVTGATTIHSGWIAAPQTTPYLGDFNRVRVFYDGMELRELDPRAGGVLDLTQINLWSAEDVTIEQTADEVRVHIRSWRTRLTTPITRTDIATGDQQTNLYRGFLARRFGNGAAIQFAAQQYGTTPPSVFGNASDQLGIVGRLGWAGRRWSIDALASRTGRHRGAIFGQPQLGQITLSGDSIPSVESHRTDAYVRAGFGDADTSVVWAQVMAASTKYDYTGDRTFNIALPRTPAESLLAFASLDTSRFRSQYIVSAGSVLGPARISGGLRLSGSLGQRTTAPWGRASVDVGFATLAAYAEGKSFDSTSRVSVTARLTPFSFVSVLGSVGRTSDSRIRDTTFGTNSRITAIRDSSFSTNYVRGELGLRLFNLWILGGAMRRDSTLLTPPRIYDTLFRARADGPATAATLAIRGQLWRLIHVDASAIRWSDTTGFYRPQYQTRSELFVRTNLLDRFHTGNLGIMFSAIHEYRSGTRYPVGTQTVISVPGYRTISTLLEIRVLSATLSWQFRNLLGERYLQVPFFVAPRQTNFYGVRWEFYN